MQETMRSVILWSAIILGIGLFAGAVNGYVVAVLKVAPFIATLASWWNFNGLALLVLEDPGGKVAKPLKAFIRGDPLGNPNSLLVILFLVIFSLIFKRTRLCTPLYAVGSEPFRSRLNGLSVIRTPF